MPIYEYVCQSCGQKTEVLQKRNDPAPECTVDACKDGALVRVLSAHNVGSSGYAAPPQAGGCGSCDKSPSCPMAS